jgi:hypothetical protein
MLTLGAWACPPGNDQGGVELNLVVKAIEDALKESQAHAVAGFPDLTSVSVTLQNTVSKEIGGKVKVLVFNAGGGGRTDKATSMTFSMKPPPKERQVSVSSFKPADIKNILSREIASAQAGFLEARNAATYLQTNKVEIEVAFSVEKKGEGGIDTGELLPVGVQVGGAVTKKTGNKITLTYGE